MESETEGKRRNGLTVIVLIAIVSISVMIASSIVDRLSPPGEPLWYMVGAGIIAGLLAGVIASVIRKRGH